jgi:hypothetical protein
MLKIIFIFLKNIIFIDFQGKKYLGCDSIKN